MAGVLVAAFGAESTRRRVVTADRLASIEIAELRQNYARALERVAELEVAQRQLELYAEDVRRTFAQLRTQLNNMNELHEISTAVGSILDPNEVMQRTLEGVGRLVTNDAATIYVIEGDIAQRAYVWGREDLAPPPTVALTDACLGAVLGGHAPSTMSPDGRALTVAMRASGTIVGALHLVREDGPPLTDDDRKLADLIAAEAAAAIHNARLYEQTQRLATTDPLTGLFNFRYFRDSLAMEVARASRLGYAVGLLMIDADNFKRVNDTFGHPVGDDVLRDIGRLLQTNLRLTDVAARYGGEEFVVILPGLGLRGVRAVGEKLRRAVHGLEPLVSKKGERFPITISIGGVSWSPPHLDSSELVRVADTALYHAKQSGKDRVCVLPDEDSNLGIPEKREDHDQAHRPAS